MSKRNVSYTKPDEPAFLKRLKKAISYKEGYNVDTKREVLHDGPEDLSDDEVENPQVVVLAPGDLTKEEADVQKAKILKEEQEKPADLNQRVIFKPCKKERITNNDKHKCVKSNANKVSLSFQDDEDEED